MISPEMQAKVAKIQELYEEATKDKEAYFQWRLVQRAAYDRDSIRAAYEEQGWKKGYKKGVAKAFAKAKAEGRDESDFLRIAVPDIVKDGFSVESIAEMLNLSVEEISKYL